MYYSNNICFTCADEHEAARLLRLLQSTEYTPSGDSSYNNLPFMRMVASLKPDGGKLVSEEESFYTPEDAVDVFREIATLIAASDITSRIDCEVQSEGECSESVLHVEIEEGNVQGKSRIEPNDGYEKFCEKMYGASEIDAKTWRADINLARWEGIRDFESYIDWRGSEWDNIFYQPSYDRFMSIMRDEFDAPSDAEMEVTEIVIPEGVRTIYQETFEMWDALEKVVFPSSLRTIGMGAFQDCGRLKCLCGKPISEITVEDWAFDDCYDLADENGFIIINGKLFASPARFMYEVLTVPDGVEEISPGAFWSVPDEYDILLPGAVRNGCRVVNLPPGVKRVRLEDFGSNTEEINIHMATKIIQSDRYKNIRINRYS